ncbi:phage portal protein [Roseospira marina]|uniref:Phage portal protein n=2 Tax=Roseospira marina TaxID=140057 RepID=A0A5M6I836_9PROT|nr:phage portal protein [Roseospira marina]
MSRFIKRRHPEYAENVGHWDFLEATYRGGRAWFEDHIFHYIKEGDAEFKDRLARAYRFNHTREIVDLLNKYIFRSPIARNTKDADRVVQAFWKNATLSGLNVDQYMKLLANRSSVFGRVWVFVDNNRRDGALTISEDAKTRFYSYFVKPQDAMDMGFTETGDLNWILVREYHRNDEDPLRADGKVEERFRLWTRDSWHLFKVNKQKRGSGQAVLLDEAMHNLGQVPCFALDHMLGERKYVSDAMIADTAYLDRAVANYLSNLDAIIQDQTFSQLAMPAQNLMPGEDDYVKLLEMGTKRIFLFNGEGGGVPMYISPDVKQAEIIVGVINKIISEIYHSVGMAGERTKQDNAVGIDNSSGVAKAYDFERLNSLLVSKAESLDRAENQLVHLILLWAGKSRADDEADLVRYPRDFDTRGLYDEFDIAERLARVEAPDVVRREQMKDVVDKLFPALSKDLVAEIERELKDWPPTAEGMIETMQAGAGAAARGAGQDQLPRNAEEQNRQGQVTRNTADAGS